MIITHQIYSRLRKIPIFQNTLLFLRIPDILELNQSTQFCEQSVNGKERIYHTWQHHHQTPDQDDPPILPIIKFTCHTNHCRLSHITWGTSQTNILRIPKGNPQQARHKNIPFAVFGKNRLEKIKKQTVDYQSQNSMFPKIFPNLSACHSLSSSYVVSKKSL